MSSSDYDTPPCTEPVGEGQPPRTVDPGRGDVGTWITRMIMELMEGQQQQRPVVEERRRARAACDLEGNRAGLGCLEHLGNALSFAVVTEWPVRVYPRRRRWSPPHACLE